MDWIANTEIGLDPNNSVIKGCGVLLTLIPICFPIKIQNIWTPEKFAVIILKFELWLYPRVEHPKDEDRIANSVDPD